ncbi:MAG: hypothetical protein Q8L00_02525, partial [Deltaproteobacteria bacterium]|nr:hypothetical protein [Deltaproteobacteria bacterium]
GHLRGSVLKGVALMTDIALRFGLSGNRLFIFLLATTVTATHEQSPLPWYLGFFPLKSSPPDSGPEATTRWAAGLDFQIILIYQ